jgi:hypothetical protein
MQGHPPIEYRPSYYVAESLWRFDPASDPAMNAAASLGAARGPHRTLLAHAYSSIWPDWFDCVRPPEPSGGADA